MTNLRIHPLWRPLGGCKERFPSSALIKNCVSQGFVIRWGLAHPWCRFPGCWDNLSLGWVQSQPYSELSVSAWLSQTPFLHFLIYGIFTSLVRFFPLSLNLHNTSLALVSFLASNLINNEFGFWFLPIADCWNLRIPLLVLVHPWRILSPVTLFYSWRK